MDRDITEGSCRFVALAALSSDCMRLLASWFSCNLGDANGLPEADAASANSDGAATLINNTTSDKLHPHRIRTMVLVFIEPDMMVLMDVPIQKQSRASSLT
jgi:hypothetical protein